MALWVVDVIGCVLESCEIFKGERKQGREADLAIKTLFKR